MFQGVLFLRRAPRRNVLFSSCLGVFLPCLMKNVTAPPPPREMRTGEIPLLFTSDTFLLRRVYFVGQSRFWLFFFVPCVLL